MVREAGWVKESFRNLILWNTEGTCKVQTGLKDCSLISEGGKAAGMGVVTRESIDFLDGPVLSHFLNSFRLFGVTGRVQNDFWIYQILCGAASTAGGGEEIQIAQIVKENPPHWQDFRD